jgi:hypothetical protein
MLRGLTGPSYPTSQNRDVGHPAPFKTGNIMRLRGEFAEGDGGDVVKIVPT